MLRDVVLALPFGETHQIDALVLDELLDATDERLGHRRHCVCRGEPLTPVLAQISDRGPDRLQVRHIDVEVHPVDGLNLQFDVIAQDFRH